MIQRSGWRAAAWIAGLAFAVSVASVGSAVLAEEPLLGERQARIFQQACAQCHIQPIPGVPLLGDEAEWAPRRARGFDAVLAGTVNGVGGMPPLGTCSFCTEDDLRRLVAFMAGWGRLPDGGESVR